jgi:hypothetical protein
MCFCFQPHRSSSILRQFPCSGKIVCRGSFTEVVQGHGGAFYQRSPCNWARSRLRWEQ